MTVGGGGEDPVDPHPAEPPDRAVDPRLQDEAGGLGVGPEGVGRDQRGSGLRL